MGMRAIPAILDYIATHFLQLWGISIAIAVPVYIAAIIASWTRRRRFADALVLTSAAMVTGPLFLAIFLDLALTLLGQLAIAIMPFTWGPAYFLSKYLGWAWAITIVASLWAAIALVARWRRSVLAKRAKAIIAQEEPGAEREPPPPPTPASPTPQETPSPEHIELLPQPPRKMRPLARQLLADSQKALTQEEVRLKLLDLCQKAKALHLKLDQTEKGTDRPPAESLNSGEENQGETTPPGQSPPQEKPRVIQPRLPLVAAPKQKLNLLHNLLWFRARKKDTPPSTPLPS